MKNYVPLVIGLTLIGVWTSVFTVREDQFGILFRFGEIVRSDFEPGLHFKVPIYNTVRRIDKRILSLEAPPERFLTLEKKDVIVDSVVKWRVEDPRSYLTSVAANENDANARLSQIIADGLRAEFSKRTLRDVVTAGREGIIAGLIQSSNEKARELGVRVVDLRIKRINLPDEVSVSVYQRMRAERERVASELRSQGQEEAEKIRAEADRRVQVIVAEADRDSQRLRGEGDATAARLYAEAYSKDADFYGFVRSLQAYRESFAGGGDVLIIDPTSDYFRHFDRSRAPVSSNTEAR